MATAAKLLANAEEQRPKVAGLCNGEAFDDMRDVDDLMAGFFEVLTSTGKYYWIPTETIATVEMHRPERPRDLIWRRAAMDVTEGPDGEVFLPVIYVTPGVEVDERTQLGRVTDYVGSEGEPVRGVGQRHLPDRRRGHADPGDPVAGIPRLIGAAETVPHQRDPKKRALHQWHA